MQVAIFREGNYAGYDKVCQELGLNLDIYYTVPYLRHEALNKGAVFEIFFVRKGDGVFIYPFLKTELPEVYGCYYDISSPYGYAGPVVTDPGLLEEGETLLLDYCREQHIVTEFVRYHYLYNRDVLFEKQITNSRNRTVVLLNTVQDWEAIWTHQFSSINRNLVRKLEKEGYTFELINYNAGMDRFITMYYETMRHAGADQQYFFTREYFMSLGELGDSIFMCQVRKDDTVYAMSLFFETAGILTYFLSARNIDYPKVSASNLLLSKVAAIARERGCWMMNFGGGLSDRPEDPLFRFKTNFSRQTAPFHIGKRIHLPHVYEDIGRIYQEIKKGQMSTVNGVLQYYHNI